MTDVPPALKDCRKQIDDIDRRIIALLRERFDVVEKVVGIKRAAGIPAHLQDRVDEVLNHVRDLAKEAGVPEHAATAVWAALIDATIRHEDTKL